MHPSKALPGLTKELVEALNSIFPERCAEPEWSDRDVWINTGRRLAVRYIINKYNEQVKAAIESKQTSGATPHLKV